MHKSVDVAIIGGGPGGSTVGTLVKKYAPEASVLILEREVFPRDHVGESLLPVIGPILDEMGCWDKVEAADFPVKIGATFRWGTTDELWDFVFLPEEYKEQGRPGKFAGQRSQTAWQVDRSKYDSILLNHAREFGCDVCEGARVAHVLKSGDRVTGLELEDGTRIAAKFYVDASGHSGIVRRNMGVQVDTMTKLQNIAIWEYWQNSEWLVNIGVGGTRVLVMSLGYGWLWFIPLGPSRTSIGLVCPGAYYKQSGKKAEELYAEAVQTDPLIRKLTANATREGKLFTTSDWSFLAERLTGENWLLVGEAAGFADPILAAGVVLTQTGARQAAYVLLELLRGCADEEWLKQAYNDHQRSRISQHIRFADFWYSANTRFTELKDFCVTIAEEAGLNLEANEAFQWLGTGGFTSEDFGVPSVAGHSIGSIKQLTQRFTQTSSDWVIARHNLFKLNLEGAKEVIIPVLNEGRVHRAKGWKRGTKTLPYYGLHKMLIDVLQKDDLLQGIVERLAVLLRQDSGGNDPRIAIHLALDTLETMVQNGWVIGDVDPAYGLLPYDTPDESPGVHSNRDVVVPI